MGPAWLPKQFRKNELSKSYLLSSGKMNPWDMPEFNPMRNTMTKERDLGLADYARNLSRSGVEGPGAALGMEKYNDQFSDRLLDYVNQIRGQSTDKGLNIGSSIIDDAWKSKEFDMKTAMAWQGQHDQRKQQPNDWEKWNKGIQQGVGTATSLANFGLGGAALAGFMPPGLKNMASSAANGGMSGLNGMDFMAMMKKMFPQMFPQ